MADFNEWIRITEAENKARRAANLRAKESAVVTPADMLRAADLLDQAADAATPGPWSVDSGDIPEYLNVASQDLPARAERDANARLIALMGPDAARALAGALRDESAISESPNWPFALAADWAVNITRRILEAQ